MTFISIAFIFFLVFTVAAFYLSPKRWRWAVLLIGSCYFYAAFVPKYLLVLFLLVLIDFVFAKKIEINSGRRRFVYFIGALVANVSMLFVFKYFNFFNENIAALAEFLHWNYPIEALELVLPLGLSFHIFQSISYVIEVYRGKSPAERHLGIYTLYVFFFPQLVAGPIERPGHLMPQLKHLNAKLGAHLFSGMRLMAWGFFKKLVIADSLAQSVNYIYGDIGHATGPTLVFAGAAFAFQLYADFSGYSDIARGSARVLGVNLVRNFEQPYFSASVAEFWRRWHISLSSWFRDYVYYPLVYGARRITPGRVYGSILFTFLLMGLWHGAGWNFVVLGGLHGMYLILGLRTKEWRGRIAARIGLARVPVVHHVVQAGLTFLLVSASWVFFRSPDLATALTFFERLLNGWYLSPLHYISTYVLYPFLALGISRNVLIVTVCCIFIMLAVEYLEQKKPVGVWLDTQPLILRSFAYTCVVLTIILFGVFSVSPFIYFQF